MNKRILKFFLIGISCLILAILAVFIFGSGKKTIIADKQAAVILVKAAQRLQTVWEEGDIDNKWQQECQDLWGKLPNVDREFFKCNPLFLQCVLRRASAIDSTVSARKQNDGMFYSVVTRSKFSGVKIPSFAVLVELEHNGQVMPVLLEDSCKEVYLPQRIYALGTFDKNKNDWRWDNFSQHIFIDKYLVTNLDISLWKGQKFGTSPALPATGLSWQEMQDYCRFMGKELAATNVYDAATFHPGDYADTTPEKNIRGPYPWSRKAQDSYLYQAIHDADFVFNRNFCHKVYTKECVPEFALPAFDRGTAAWTGIFQVLGGVMEALNNPVVPKQNVRVSSMYFDVKSSWHQLGKRAHWDGEHFDKSAFSWEDDWPDGDYKVGFRCMRMIR